MAIQSTEGTKITNKSNSEEKLSHYYALDRSVNADAQNFSCFSFAYDNPYYQENKMFNLQHLMFVNVMLLSYY